jgi:hypothetical protein
LDKPPGAEQPVKMLKNKPTTLINFAFVITHSPFNHAEQNPSVLKRGTD